MRQHVMENQKIGLVLDLDTGTLSGIINKLTGETYGVVDDSFAIEAEEFSFGSADCTMESIRSSADTLKTVYRLGEARISVVYTLRPNTAFAEKQVSIVSGCDYRLKRVVVSKLIVQTDQNTHKLVSYRHPDFGPVERHVERVFHSARKRKPDTEPCSTFFGRTPIGGLMTGMELSFDSSYLHGNEVTLACVPNLKVRANANLLIEPAYFGVYQRNSLDQRADEWRMNEASHVIPAVMPLPSESLAMVELTAAVLGPRRYRELAAVCCGWHSQMGHWEFTEESVQADIKAIELMKECGINWLTEQHPWCGQLEQTNSLGENDSFVLEPLSVKFLEHARNVGVQVIQWATMNNTHPWLAPAGKGQPFRRDKPDWIRDTGGYVPSKSTDESGTIWDNEFIGTKANCIASEPFSEWIFGIFKDALNTGYFAGWVMDGDFWGSGAFYDSTIPVECHSDQHDHLPGDANYACQKTLENWIERLRLEYPDILMTMCRPVMDLGVWGMRNVDMVFTTIETGTGNCNLQAGDEIRTVSRTRLHHHFIPHYLDWPLLFPTFDLEWVIPGLMKDWSSEKIDYIVLSALSCSPNLLFYLPGQTGIPATDKQEIKQWLDWGRANIELLMVRKDLPDWPGYGKVDGSAHIIGNSGVIFLFNPDSEAKEVDLELSCEAIGLSPGNGVYQVKQEYPDGEHVKGVQYDSKLTWRVPEQSAVILRIWA